MSTVTTPPTTVTEGFYYGFSLTEIAAEKVRYKAAVQEFTKQRQAAGGGNITFIAINGKQVTYDLSKAQAALAEWRMNLQNAEAHLAGECSRHLDRAAVQFS